MSKVSILIPLFNRKDFIVACINSASNQTFKDIEIVVVDNASTDGSWEICKELAKLDSRIKLFRNQTNIGPIKNWIRCIEEASGIYGKIVFSDDTIHSECIEEMVSVIESSSVGFSFSAVNIFNKSTGETKINYLLSKSGTYTFQSYIDDIAHMTGYFPISPGAALFRLDDLREHLQLNIKSSESSDFAVHGIGPDLLLMLQVAYKYKKIGYIRRPLVTFSAHENSISIESRPSKIAYNYDLVLSYFCKKNSCLNISSVGNRIAYHLIFYKNTEEYKEKTLKNFDIEADNSLINNTMLVITIYKFLFLRGKILRSWSKFVYAIFR